MTYITLIWFLTSVYPHMSFQFICVGACVVAVGTLVWTFSCVHSDMALQFTQFHTGIFTFCTLVRFLKCVLVSVYRREQSQLKIRYFFNQKVLGPVVQSVVSLTSSLKVISLTVLADLIHNILIFFAEKM